LPAATAMVAFSPSASLSDIALWKTPSAPLARGRWPAWGPRIPGSTCRATLTSGYTASFARTPKPTHPRHA
jgi:hypothetical protein